MERQLHCLRQIGLVLESTMGLDDVLSQTIAQITPLMEAERSTLYVADSRGVFVSRVIEGDEVSEIQLELGQGIAGWVARTGKPLNIPDAYQDHRFDPSWDKKSGFVTRCVICHPIQSHPEKNIIGVVEVLNKRDGASFDDADMELLGLLAGRLALIIENSRLMVDLVEKNKALVDAKSALLRRNQELDLLLDLERRISQSEDMGALSVSILKRVIDISHAQVGLLYLTDDTGAEMRVATAGVPGHRVFRVGLGLGFTGWVAAKGQEINLDAPTTDPRYSERMSERIGVTPKTVAAVPLLARHNARSHGAMLVANRNTGTAFDETDMSLLRLVAARFSQAIEEFSNREERERERRLATIGRLLTGVLHDLKTPMSVISGYADLLAADARSKEGETYLAHIEKALDRITTMTREIIAFSRGERRILKSSVLIEDVMTDFFQCIRPILDANNIGLIPHIRLSGAVRVDKDKLIRAFQNIVQNAVDAMQQGGSLTIEADQLGNELVFGFTDTGTGIPDEVQGTLFMSFVTLGKEHGSGLGLAVAREIVEGHGGSITFATAEGKGATFLVSIPASGK